MSNSVQDVDEIDPERPDDDLYIADLLAWMGEPVVESKPKRQVPAAGKPKATPNSNAALIGSVLANHAAATSNSRLPGNMNKYESTVQVLKSRALEFRQAATIYNIQGDLEKGKSFLLKSKQLRTDLFFVV